MKSSASSVKYQCKVIQAGAREPRHPEIEEGEFEIGSIGIQQGGAWAWGIDTIVPMRSFGTEGQAPAERDAPFEQGEIDPGLRGPGVEAA